MKKLFFNAIFFSALTVIFIGCSAASKTEQMDIQEPKIEEPKEKIIIKEKIVYKEKKVPVYITKEPKQKDSKIILGNYEYVYIPSENLKLKAKIDTGATTTSLHAINIKAFERDGKKWVKFTLENEKGELINKALPISRIVYIKRHGAKNQKRYVVQMRINVANSSQLVDVTLTDRSKFSYPVLIGKNFLTGMVLVDVSKKFTQEPIKKAK
ncbi:ATP-dependent Zn protease [Arcobacter sp. F155]|uniref:ATP-dependent zinc protease family protein n=1 Tax=Arcobacter sp. F155 TaxID=2044512 RepID=UPI00100B1E21|nr:ATP-dependent zinc protease [Arcobacter sp. F155]RXJ78868.1 ATP-dependent Zn protease [Arcobacter sp. F155]